MGSLSPQQHATALGCSPALRSDTFTLTPQDRLVLYTDGLLDAHVPGGAVLPMDRQLSSITAAEPSDVARQLLDDALRHSGRHLDDDAAVLVVDFNPASLA